MNEFDELLRRVEITCKARYRASARLKLQSQFSQWTLAFLAVGQIVIGLVPALGLHQNFSPAYITFGSIFFSVLVLGYSLLLGMGDYSARAMKIHECGMALGRLARKIYPLKSPSTAGNANLYSEFSKEYYDTLEKHENHTAADYFRAHYDYYSAIKPAVQAGSWQSKIDYFFWWLGLQKTRMVGKFLAALAFMHYLITVALIWGWIYLLVK